MPFKSEKQRKWMWANDPEMAKKWEKEEKMKQETKVRQLIRKMVREIMSEDFAGAYPKEKRAKFDKMRQKQSEVLGYKLVGKPDIKVEIDDATIKEGFQKRHFLNLIKQELESKKGQLAYAEDNIRASSTPRWERKEWLNVAKDLKKEIRNLKIRVKKVSKMEEGKLTESQQVAKTILQQLGGNRFIAMTGAKNFGSSKNSLQFKIGRNSKSISHVIITLKSSDLYDVEFIRMRGTSRKVVKKVTGVYADMLGKIFTKYTGMNVRL